MKRTNLEKKVIEIVSRYTYVVVTLDSAIRDDLGLDSMDEADVEKDLESEFNFHEDWISWEMFWISHRKVSELCDFIEERLC